MPKQENSAKKKIIVHKFGGLGDYLCSLPFFENLRILYKNADITAVISVGGEELLKKSGLVDNIIVAERPGGRGLLSVVSFSAFCDFFKIKKQLNPPYDVYIDLISKYSHLGVLKPYLTKIFSRPHYSIGLDCNGLSFYLDKKIPEDKNERKHCVEQYNEILKALDKEHLLPESPWRAYPLKTVNVSDVERRTVIQYFASFNEKKIKIGIHPGANLKLLTQHAWAVERFAELVNVINENIDCDFFVTGSEKESFLFDKLGELATCKVNRIPITNSITELAAFISKFDFYISNDTGPMHLAVAMGGATVGIFGDADYNLYGSYPDTVPFVAITRPKSKKPSSQDPRNLKDISVDEVYKAFLSLKSICR